MINLKQKKKSVQFSLAIMFLRNVDIVSFITKTDDTGFNLGLVICGYTPFYAPQVVSCQKFKTVNTVKD